MDSLISHLLSNFSNLQDIVLVGNSAGGQFVNRYAAGSDQEGGGMIRYVVSAPSSYLYLMKTDTTNIKCLFLGQCHKVALDITIISMDLMI